jgi:hypothetical protein
MEWETTSPPPTGNFDYTPQLRHGPYDYDKVVAKNAVPEYTHEH